MWEAKEATGEDTLTLRLQSSPQMVFTRGMSSVRRPMSIQFGHMLISTLAGFPDPFAVATISGEQTRTTGVIKKTLNPYWNESFDMYAPRD